MRWVFANFAGAFCLALVVRTWIALGVIAPVFVSGDSMAPGLRGIHISATCPNCGTASSVGAAYLPDSPAMPCPWCDAGKLNLELPTYRGERLLIDRTALIWRKPQRWEPVVFQCPVGNRLCVKRAAGLPGETVSIRDGDLFINGERLVKSLAAQRRLRQLLPGPGESLDPHKPVTDACVYNSGLSRQLNLVDDFFLSVQVRTNGDGELIVSGVSAGQAWRVEIRPNSGKLTLHGIASGDATTTLSPALRRAFSQDDPLLEVSTFDHQLLVAIDRQTVAKAPLAELDLVQPTPASLPPSLTTRNLEVEMTNFKLYRDFYYTTDIVGLPRSATGDCQLASGEWFLLGDNSPVSIDSRVWGPVSERLFVGKPLGVR